MRLAVLSDVHGNLPALEAVLYDLSHWSPDWVVVNGDLINRGPDSLGVLHLLREHHPDAFCLKGNHEGFVLAMRHNQDHPGTPAYEVRRFAHWSVAQLGARLDQIALWPDHLDLDSLDRGSLHITHGSRLGDREGILPQTEGAELALRLGEPRDLFISSHTHRPFQRPLAHGLLVNTGSVGAPFDRDPRPSYARFVLARRGWEGEVVRVDYDRSAAERLFEESGFLEGGGPLARVMLAELRLSRGLMGPWMRNYHAAVMAGELSLECSVQRHLAQYGLV